MTPPSPRERRRPGAPDGLWPGDMHPLGDRPPGGDEELLASTVARWYADTPPADDAPSRLAARLSAGAPRLATAATRPLATGTRLARWRLGSLAAAAAIVLLLTLARQRAWLTGNAPGRAAATAAVPADSADVVGFVLRLPETGVRQVSLAGDFNGWSASALPMRHDPATGTWHARVRLAPGRHEYSYVVNGTRWIIDSLAPRTMERALGFANVITIPHGP